jgi:hypothetical protein
MVSTIHSYQVCGRKWAGHSCAIEKLAAPDCCMRLPETNHAPAGAEWIGVVADKSPIKPCTALLVPLLARVMNGDPVSVVSRQR